MSITPPSARISIGATIGSAIALWPASLPRGPVPAILLTAACVLVATTVVRLSGTARPGSRVFGWSAAAMFAVVLVAGAVMDVLWQNIIRVDAGTTTIGAGYGAGLVAAGAAGMAAVTWFPRRTAIAALAALTVTGLFASPAASAAATQSDRASDTEVAARALTDRWLHADGLHKGAVVIAVPTGSGWVDPEATTALRARLHGDVAFLSLPYASTASWRVFVTDREAAGNSAIAVLRRVLAARDTLPPTASRPKVYLYGQSLGALGADRARAWAEAHHPGAVTGTVLVGVPADTVDPHGGAGARIVLANASDPVTRWSLASLWRPPSRPDETRTVGRAVHRPPWLPVVSFVQTSVDLLASLDGPDGTGHHYGPEQGVLP
ncbi:alpha/beta-hydrolase family protein [Gordonia sp. DT30]|uniref:alpha/beta-hydrolase family protein n=1 Tax=Gordonia sp. DT30 TaxID=3416546 RepID=UPI003CF512F4